MKKTFWLYFLSGILLFAGSILRWQNLFHLGFVYDTVDYFYAWGNAAYTLGPIKFWHDFSGIFDYLPGSVYFFGGIKWLSVFFEMDTIQGFVTVLKTILWGSDAVLAGLVFYIARNYAKKNTSTSLLLTSVTYALPSLWFVSLVVGQIDTLVVALALASVLTLYRALEGHSFRNPLAIIGGALLAMSIWLKMMAILIIPALALLYWTWRKYRILGFYSLGFIVMSVILIAPALTNVDRFIGTLLVPNTRINTTTNGAANLWSLVGLYGDSTQPLILSPQLTISIAQASTGLFLLFIGLIVLHYVKIQGLKEFIAKPKPLTMLQFVEITVLCGFVYFFFNTKVAARYIHVSAIFLILLAMLQPKNRTILLTLVFVHTAYFLNLVGGYVWWGYTVPLWPTELFKSLRFDVLRLAASLHLTAFIGLFFLRDENK